MIDEDFISLEPREGYDRWAPRYDAYNNALIALEEPVVAEMIGDVADLDVADVGCGTGRWALELAARGARVTGIDFSSGMLAQLRAKMTRTPITIVQHDITTPLPLPDGAVDVAISCLVLEHVPDLDAVLGELARIVRPAGKVVISDFHPEMIRRGLHARFRESPDGPKYQIGGAYRPIADYVLGVGRAGLTIEDMTESVMDEDTLARLEIRPNWLGEPMLLAFELRKPRTTQR